MNKKQRLIIFYRNPQLGKVKNRLASSVGEERALALYLLMAAHARDISLMISADRVVYYSEYIDTEDNWLNLDFDKRLQQGNTLGEKMNYAFEESFRLGYESVCIIGTDCFELTSEILDKAFVALETNDSVIGPAADGGYYLLGMNKFIPKVFENKEWSTDTVCKDTLNDFNQLKYTCHVLATLHDVDTKSDLPAHLR